MIPQESIAHYRIVAKLGEGGMGAVYRATDTKLNRDVAIKVLPGAFASDPDRLARFTREAQVLAALNHPNIAHIYGVEERALVMELVEGPTLAERIGRGPLPLAEALAIARQIAEALEWAHERGVVHRDLKPANIKLTPEGRVKVLDFGLAKSLACESYAGDPEASPTVTMQSTVAGTILGTAAYMSPEQARGQAIDRRADIWAFGAVLFEMLTGRRAFARDTVADTLAAVLNSEPDYSLFQPNLPVKIEYLLKRCLHKKLSDRLRDIGEARIWIDESESQPAERVRRVRNRAWIALGFTGMLGAAITLGAYLWRALSPPAPSTWKGTFLGGPSRALGPRISPDGKILAFQVMVDGLLQVAVMKPESANWTVLTRERNNGPVQEITWSPEMRTTDSICCAFRAPACAPGAIALSSAAQCSGDGEGTRMDGSAVRRASGGAKLGVGQSYHLFPATLERLDGVSA
jgi:serine/threonine-protein kinase